MSAATARPDFKIDFQQLRVFYKKGSVIFHENDLRDNAYIIESGEVEISTTREGRKLPLVRLGKGEVFGETALLGSGARTATAITLEDTEVFVISPKLLRDRIVHLDPLVGLLMSLLVNRYRRWRYRSPEAAAQDEIPPRAEENLANGAEADSFMHDLQRQREIALTELRMAQEITLGIEKRQFEPWLQPIMNLSDGRLSGFEALIRWSHPLRGLVPPVEFIPLAERTQVVGSLDMLILRKACELLPALQAAAGKTQNPLYISVNLSGARFCDNDITGKVETILRETGANPKQLMLEITETALIDDPAAAEIILRDIKKLGVSLALDDFGTGYSSLSYLHRFPFDLLKIDRAFVQNLHRNGKSMDIIRAIVSLSKNFNLKIVGEGIENAEEIDALVGLGCEYGQGFLFSKPLPLDKALEFAAKNGPAAQE